MATGILRAAALIGLNHPQSERLINLINAENLSGLRRTLNSIQGDEVYSLRPDPNQVKSYDRRYR
jgi:hypothetical protein